jgi:uncharacterized membrane protein YhaH (DUF805 family)
MEYWCIMIVAFIAAAVGVSADVESVQEVVAANSYMISPYASGEEVVSALIQSGMWFPTGSVIALLLAGPPSIAVTSRRLHDLGVTGWATLAMLIPTIGQIGSIIIGLPAGKKGDNQYGPDPLG